MEIEEKFINKYLKNKMFTFVYFSSFEDATSLILRHFQGFV